MLFLVSEVPLYRRNGRVWGVECGVYGVGFTALGLQCEADAFFSDGCSLASEKGAEERMRTRNSKP